MIDFAIFMITMASIWAVLALSLNIQFGLTGLVNFGQILPFAVGAFAVAIAATHGLPVWAGVVGGLAAGPLIGALVIFPTRRMTQDYWALASLGMAELFRLTMLNFRGIAGGVDGTIVPRFSDRTLAMVLAVGALVLAFVVAERISRAPLGRFLRVIREDETLAATLGRNPFRYQTVAVAVSWMMASGVGILYAHVTGFVHHSSFMVIETFIIWTAVIVGGPGRNIGVVIGAVVLQAMSVSTRFVAQWTDLPSDLVANLRLAAVGLLLVVMIVYRPEGLFREKPPRYHADG